ncbi:MAG TPA: ABC transporter ATP-binding protein [Candidatus Dormibacteraeota bacterium]
MSGEPLLEVRGLGVNFGGVRALSDVSFTLHRGEILGVIGPNGAGKTTLFNAISGVLRNYQGEVTLGSRSLRGLNAQQVVARGLARTFQNIRLFRSLTVIDHVMAGQHRQMRESFFDSALHTPRFRRAELGAVREARRILAFVGLAGVDPGAAASSLPYGAQRRLEIARSLATQPAVLMLDEPAAGMNTAESVDLGRVVRRVRDSGTAVLLVEHDMRVVMSVCDRIVVLNFGRAIATAPPQEIQENPEVIAAYLGTEAPA